MKASIILEVNKKRIHLSLLEAIELRNQLNELTGLHSVGVKQPTVNEENDLELTKYLQSITTGIPSIMGSSISWNLCSENNTSDNDNENT